MKHVIPAVALLLSLSSGLSAALAANVTMFVRHEVADYATWRKGYDAFNTERKALGVTRASVYQAIDNPNDVTVTHVFKTPEQAKAFAASDKFKSVMEKAGVKGKPQIWLVSTPARGGKSKN